MTPSQQRTNVSIRPSIVGYITAFWQEEYHASEDIIIDLFTQAAESGESSSYLVLDLLDSLADMVLMLIESAAHASDADCQQFVASILARLGQDAMVEP